MNVLLRTMRLISFSSSEQRLAVQRQRGHVTPTRLSMAGPLRYLVTAGGNGFGSELQLPPPPAAPDSFRLVAQMNVTFLTIVQSACLFPVKVNTKYLGLLGDFSLSLQSRLFPQQFIFNPFHHSLLFAPASELWSYQRTELIS